MERQQPPARERIRELAASLDHVRRLLEAHGVNRDLLASYQKLIDFLKQLKVTQAEAILGMPYESTAANTSLADAASTAEGGFANLTTEQAEALLDNPRLSRKEIVQIAKERFGFPPGQLSAHKSKATLIEEIRALLENERTHAAIARAATAEDR
jgi:hypothetical protein